MNWDKTLIRCSCIGKIMAAGRGTGITEKQLEYIKVLQDKPSRTEKQELELAELIAKRDAPVTLGDTCTSYLKEVYVWEKYKKEPVGGAQRSKYTEKGKTVENDSIELINRLDGTSHIKNEERLTNDYLTGEPDIIVGEDIRNAISGRDIKSSWDFATLLSNIGSPLNPLYWAQMQGYMALTNSKEWYVDYCLVNMPQEIIEGEKKRMFYIMNPATEENIEYKRAIEKIEWNMTFDEIPLKERRYSFKVDRDDAYIAKVYEKVKMCREWLASFEKIHNPG